MRPLQLGAFAVAALAFAFSPATIIVAQERIKRDDAWLMRSSEASFFNLDVTGTPTSPQGGVANDAARWGKAFAIGPDLLLTANHVLGDWDEWRVINASSSEITRAARPIDRKISLARAGDDRVMNDVVVMPSPSAAIDAATMRVPGLDVPFEAQFQISLCEIRDGENYSALVTSADDPRSVDSLRSPLKLDLKAVGFEPAKYGGLYVFDADPTADFHSEPWGHDGSPIFDDDYNVVALIAAVTVESGRTKVLATPIQPLIPGTYLLLAQDPNLTPGEPTGPKCSMADLVDRIDYQVGTYSVWDVALDRDENGEPTGQVKFTYDSVLDTPNITGIHVEYQFWGKEKKGQDFITRILFNSEGGESDGNSDIDPPGSKPTRTFRDDDILNTGTEILGPKLKETDGEIVFVRVLITPTYIGNQPPRAEPFRIDVPWSEFEVE